MRPKGGHCIAIGDFLVSIVISTRIWSMCARYHHIQRCALFLVILHRMVIWWFHRNYFALVLLETVWCRAELSALHHVSRCWNFILAERDVFGERTWDLREFCELEEHCTARFWLSTSFLIVQNLVFHVWMRTGIIWELLEVDQTFVAGWICDSALFGIVKSTF